MTNKPSHDNSAVSEWKGELYNANLYIDLYKFPQRIKVKIMFLNFSLAFFLINGIFVAEAQTFFLTKRPKRQGALEKRLYSQARGLSASVSFLSSPPLSRPFKKESLLAGYLSRSARPNKSREDEKRRKHLLDETKTAAWETILSLFHRSPIQAIKSAFIVYIIIPLTWRKTRTSIAGGSSGW